MKRIRVISGPWPERIGCEGVILERPTGPEGKVYPWNDRSSNVIIRLDNDPLTPGAEWSCSISPLALEVLD